MNPLIAYVRHGEGFFYAVVMQGWTVRRNCWHRHRERWLAERCAARLVDRVASEDNRSQNSNVIAIPVQRGGF